MIYKWKEGSHHKVSAQIAGEVCAELEVMGRLSAENLVDVSRPEDAPLHSEFEWNDDIAAEMYRRTQAGQIIRHLSVKTETKTPVRAFFNIEVRNKEFESIQAIIRNEDKYAALLEQALRELEAFQRKYQMLSELQGIFDAITGIKNATCVASTDGKSAAD